ncbi:redoxin domain-containing protein [Amphibacillus cookii]|uniref:redoxin domain-containing protein n=1 Tax=Amphibacillus cookii TaxID=767787 RepID=UPI00195EEFEF|nr:thiol-disulfide isomerase/thioredoxin [Amphibacillus cookii]
MRAPDFCLPYIDRDQYYQLSDQRGKIVVLTFWASWCPDCSNDLPLKERLYQSIDQTKMSFITINVVGRERDPNEGIRYYQKFLSQPTLIDHGIDVYRKYNCLGVPTTVIIDQQGYIIKQFTDQAKPLDIMETIGELI